MRRLNRTASLAVAALLLTACGGEVGDEPVAEPPESGQDTDDTDDDLDEPADDPAAGGSDPLLGPEIQIAIDDVIERAGVAREDVLITVTELVTWPDSSLGCPEPDTMYTQALVEGYQIVLEAGGEEYHYHGADGDDPQYCADPQSPIE